MIPCRSPSMLDEADLNVEHYTASCTPATCMCQFEWLLHENFRIAADLSSRVALYALERPQR